LHAHAAQDQLTHVMAQLEQPIEMLQQLWRAVTPARWNELSEEADESLKGGAPAARFNFER
jgi:hypothetical protein